MLAIGAHPDDVEIGVGGTLAVHRAAGDPSSSSPCPAARGAATCSSRRHEALAAAELIGARLFLQDLEDTRIDPAGGLHHAIEELIAEIEPTVVYTHCEHDRHQDHRAVRQAATSPPVACPTLACFQSPSSTIDFRPNRFVPIDEFLDTKLRCWRGSSRRPHRDYMEPDLVRATARYWSRFGGGQYAEPLEMVRAAAMLSTKSRATGVAAPRRRTRRRARRSRMRVLVTGAGGPAGVAVIRSLQRRGDVEVIAADMDRCASGLYLVDAGRGTWSRPGRAADSSTSVARSAATSASTSCSRRSTSSCPSSPPPASAAGATAPSLAAPSPETLEVCLDKFALAARARGPSACPRTGCSARPRRTPAGTSRSSSSPAAARAPAASADRRRRPRSPRARADEDLLVQELCRATSTRSTSSRARRPRGRRRAPLPPAGGLRRLGRRHDRARPRTERPPRRSPRAIGLITVANVQLRDADGRPPCSRSTRVSPARCR